MANNVMNDRNTTESHLLFLTLAYNRFYDLYEEVMNELFWEQDEWVRFSKISQAFSIYVELLNYEPLKVVIKELKTLRPSMESEIGSELFKFIRNVIAHFPFFKSWGEIWINCSMANCWKQGQTIDKYLRKYEAREEVKYRFWEREKGTMTYITINFPDAYTDNSKVFLKDIVSERDGVKFCFILMKNIMDTQVEEIKHLDQPLY